ncbi:BMP family ABC transporter substrate-binding protein [Candidatus Haliotispira prima]|uniref:BMP family ABC transporter substrate-binding protein n=1 Tax=Candidatus Haliotispira prima TaxID=3034016 RepID=A0ABY8MHI4_9SPIO|nr:BMP family ABC transporter substrate-binding protein [Candidatus Haliotispira prima]
MYIKIRFPMLLTLLMLVSLVMFACNKKEADVDVVPDSEEVQVTVRLGTDASGVDDKSFNASAWRGITRFYGDTPENPLKQGSHYDYIISNNTDKYVSNLRLMSEGGYSLVIVTGFTWADALSQVAPDYPQQKFMIVDVAGLPNDAKNIMEVIYAEEQGAFLAGVAAALQAKEVGAEPKFGFIGGIPGAVITHFQVGYMQGILTISPDAEILDYYANDWADPAKAKIQAEAWFDSGVYAIFSAAGSTGNGAIQVAKESRQRGRDVWAIGVDSDQYGEGLYEEGKSAILTSMIKRVDAATELALMNVRDETFQAEVVRLDLANSGVGLPENNPNLSDAILAEVKDYEQKVINGEIVVDNTVAAFISAGHLGEGLTILARDD